MANSEGWTCTGPTAIQLRLPMTSTPSGVNTSACSISDPPSTHTPSRFQSRTGIRLATKAPITPSTAKRSWPRKTV